MAKTATAPRRFTVKVTDEAIEKAKVNDSYQCVVAQGVAASVPGATNIDVDTQSIRLTVDGERRVYMTPYAVQGYIIAFDAGDPIEPFSFQLRNPRITARRVRTEAGKAVQRATNQAKRTVEKKKIGKKADTSDPNKAARAAYAEAVHATAGEPLSKMTAGKQPTPRVFKKKRRAYGHRLLRINQD